MLVKRYELLWERALYKCELLLLSIIIIIIIIIIIHSPSSEGLVSMTFTLMQGDSGSEEGGGKSALNDIDI